MKILKSSLGYSVIELMIATVLTGIISMAGFRFYVQMHNQTIAQEEISDMQQRSRSALNEMSRTLRMAGYKIDSHSPYVINNDTLYVFFNDTQPVDTVIYYLSESTEDTEFDEEESAPIYSLMMKRNSDSPTVYADYISNLEFDVIDASSIEIVLEVQATKPDEAFNQNDGIRTFANSEIVTMRNLTFE